MQSNREEKRKPKFAVLGAGHGGLAMAGHLAIMGFEVSLYNRGDERLWGVAARGGVDLEGEVVGFGKIPIVTISIEEAVRDADVIMVVVPATGHRYMAEQCAPYLTDDQIVILHPGRTFGAIEFRQVLTENQCKANVVIAEAQTFLYASRVIGPGQARIFGIKNSIPVASIRAHLIPRVLSQLRIAYPQFVAGDNVFKTSFDNIGAIFHPTLCVLNAGWIESEAEFQFYLNGASPSVARVLERVDAERIEVAEALGIRAMSARQWLYIAYDSVGADLHTAIRVTPGYRGIMAPTNLQMRYIQEDVPASLVPIASIGKMLGVETPIINSIITMASVINQCDYWAAGRTVERLGIQNMSLRDLRLFAIGEGASGDAPDRNSVRVDLKGEERS